MDDLTKKLLYIKHARTTKEIEQLCFHEPAQKAINDCRALGVDEGSIKKGIDHHIEMCRSRGIGVGNLI